MSLSWGRSKKKTTKFNMKDESVTSSSSRNSECLFIMPIGPLDRLGSVYRLTMSTDRVHFESTLT